MCLGEGVVHGSQVRFRYSEAGVGEDVFFYAFGRLGPVLFSVVRLEVLAFCDMSEVCTCRVTSVLRPGAILHECLPYHVTPLGKIASNPVILVDWPNLWNICFLRDERLMELLRRIPRCSVPLQGMAKSRRFFRYTIE